MAKTVNNDEQSLTIGSLQIQLTPPVVSSEGSVTTEGFDVSLHDMKLVEIGKSKSVEANITKLDTDNRLVFGWFNVPFPARIEKFFAPEGSAEDLLESIAHAFRHQFPSSNIDSVGDDFESRWIIATYPNEGWVIASAHSHGETTYFRHDFVASGDTFVFGNGIELEVVYIEKELGLDTTQVPKVDLQGDRVPMKELEKAAYTFVLESRDGGAVHEEIVADLVESFMATDEKYEAMGIPKDVIADLNKGWWGGFHVNDDDAWDKIKSGEYGMFSIGGHSMATDV